MRQCITWDGQSLACLDLTGPSDEVTLLYHIDQPGPQMSFPVSRLGVIQALILHCNNETTMKGVKDLLEVYSIEEFLRFYMQAHRHGLLGKDFAFMMMAVLQSTVLAVRVSGRRACQVFHVPREEVLAVGRDASAAILLMDTAAKAPSACGAFMIDPLNATNASYYLHVKSLTFLKAGEPYPAATAAECSSTYERDGWHYTRHDNSVFTFRSTHARPRWSPLMENLYTKLRDGESIFK